MRRLIILAAALGACSNHATNTHMEFPLPTVIAVAPTEGAFESTQAVDLDPEPTVVEVDLEAQVTEVELAPGRRVSMWTYNGVLPGPRIEAQVGDTVRIQFRNSLPEETTIHWHGLRVPARMDGVAAMQTPVPPGGTFLYEFVVPDAGTFWYHPHVRSDEQVERGLYGAIVVRGPGEPETTTDRTVVLDDILLGADGSLAAFDDAMAMPGRQGNLILANGRARPIAAMERGGLHRFRFINAANARYFRLALPGRSFTQIGTDGGLLEAPQTVTELLLVPGERADVLVVADGAAGEALDWKSLRYDRGHGTGALPDVDIFQMRQGEGAPIATPPVPATLGAVPRLPAATVQRRFELEESMGGGHGGHGSGGATFSINGETFPDVRPLAAELGAVEDWTIVNTTEMDHPFHLHGFRFQITEIDGQAVPFAAWRDTLNIPAKKTVVFRTRLDDHAGTWMFHCHILEHAERGMMGMLEVVGPEGLLPETQPDPHAGH